MNVWLIDHAPIAGGVEMMVRDLLAALDGQFNVAPTVVTDIHSPMRGRFSPTVPEIALPLTRLKRNPAAGAALLASAARLARAARQGRAQVLQTFTARTHMIGALAGVLSGVPVVWRLNDDTLPRPLVSAFGRVPRRIISVSDFLRRHYAGALRVTHVIPDGVPLPPLITAGEARRGLNLPAQALVVVLVARLVRWKGHAVFLRALSALAGEFPQLHGLVVGGWSPADDVPGPLGGGEAYANELRALAQDLGLAKRVTFTGHVDTAGNVFAAADVVAHTSVLPEPFGRVIVEAMAAARPVVAAQAGGAPEIVVPGETGVLVPPDDPAALAAALRPLLADPTLRQRLGAAGRTRAEQHYSVAVMAERFVKVWQEVK